MQNLSYSLTLYRHPTNGGAALRGRIGKERLDLKIHRGASDGTARISGDWGAQDNVNLRFHRNANDGYHHLEGTLKGKPVDANLDRRVDGDSEFTVGEQTLEIDRDSRGKQVRLKGEKIKGPLLRDLREGDEQANFSIYGDRVRFSLDRDPVVGDFHISGRSDSRFKLDYEPINDEKDRKISGSLPEGSETFPLLWEILGDDKNVPDNNPMYPSSVLAMSHLLLKESEIVQ